MQNAIMVQLMPQSEQQFRLEFTTSNASLSPSGSLDSLNVGKELTLPQLFISNTMFWLLLCIFKLAVPSLSGCNKVACEICYNHWTQVLYCFGVCCSPWEREFPLHTPITLGLICCCLHASAFGRQTMLKSLRRKEENKKLKRS